MTPDLDVIGPLAFSPDDRTVYFASPNTGGTVDLWSADRTGGAARQLTALARDTYAPSTSRDGTVLFKTQTYRTTVAERDLAGGSLPRAHGVSGGDAVSYSADGTRIAVTFGTWRRVIDDAKYPDIAQDIGLIAAGDGAGIHARARRDRRAVRLRRSGDGVVAQRQVDRVPLAQGAVR